MRGPLQIQILPGGDISQAPWGSHIVLEANSGVLLHALRMPDGLFALRSGRARQFQVAKAFPAAAVVNYPPPFGPPSDAERAQAINRASGLVGLDRAGVVERLIRAGAVASELAEGGDAFESECVASFCATGVCRSWRVAEAYCAAKAPVPASPLFGGSANVASSEACFDSSSWAGSSLPPGSSPYTGPAPTTTSGVSKPLSSGGDSSVKRLGELSLEKADGLSLHENAIHTAMHCGLRGPAAKVVGTAAAVGCEGYRLYSEVSGHKETLEHQKISEGQYQERVCDSTVTASSRALGGFAGAAAGQAMIPVPVVGAVVGSVVGATCGGLHAESLLRGAWRLSGGKAKGGDDLVRCVEHYPKSNGENSSGLDSCPPKSSSDLFSSDPFKMPGEAPADPFAFPDLSFPAAQVPIKPAAAAESIWDDGPLL